MPIATEPPFPLSEAFAVAVAVMVYVFTVGTVMIWYSLLSTAAVILPPRLTAPEKVTKSLGIAPCAVSVIVTVADPLVAAKVTSPAAVATRIGVMS